MAMVFTDATERGNPIIFANDSFLSLTGYAREEVLGQEFNFILAHAADAETLAQVKAEFEGTSDIISEIRYRRKDGAEFWVALFISPVRDERGHVVQYFASLVDLTKHKEEETQARKLIEELNHRVKNTLSMVQSIVRQALRFHTDPREIRDAIKSRLLALSQSHDLLTREKWKSAGLRDVINDALEPFDVAGGRADRIVIVGERYPFAATNGFGPWHWVQRACNQCGEVWRALKSGGIRPGRLEDRAVAGEQSTNTALAGEGRTARHATFTLGVWLPHDRARFGPRIRRNGGYRLPAERRGLHDKYPGTTGRYQWINRFLAIAFSLLRTRC